MRKQTKVAAVASAAALLAIGASMTSFAATGWVEEGGEWFFYEKDGSKAEDVWKKSGDNWYWLDSEEGGAMAIDKLVEDDDNIYYVDSNGIMTTNTWIKVVNEEQDDDDPAEYHYYYMQGNGKAYKAGDNSSTKFKTIDGKRYTFDEEGKMLYGWVDGNGARLTGDDGWATVGEDIYYCGSWEDGAMKTGWQKITVYDEVEDEDMEHWFWFKSNGKRFHNDGTENIKEKKINSKKYGFDSRGVMVYEWTLATGSTASVSSWKYFSSPEEGARVTKGWFKVVAPTEDNSFGDVIENIGTKDDPNTFDYSKADDEAEKWYYADGDGKLKSGEIAKIKGKYYGFAPTGYMLNGLVFMSVDTEGKIVALHDDGVDSDDLDDIMNGEGKYDEFSDLAASLYYFGNDEDADGSMKTGSAVVNVDGDSHNFLFSKSGGAEGKGKGVSGIEDGKYIYKYGKKLKAGDNLYKPVWVYGSADTGSDLPGAAVIEMKNADLRADVEDHGFTGYKNKDDDTVRGLIFAENRNLYLINTTGTIIKNKTAAKDADDWYFFVDDKYIRLYTNNKTLTPKKGQSGIDLSDWKDFDYTEVGEEMANRSASEDLYDVDFE